VNSSPQSATIPALKYTVMKPVATIQAKPLIAAMATNAISIVLFMK
jgi:hypothetical protein